MATKPHLSKVPKRLVSYSNERDGWSVVVVHRINTVSELRSVLLGLAYEAGQPERHGAICLLVAPVLTVERIRNEWSMFQCTVAPRIGSRIHIAAAGDLAGQFPIPSEAPRDAEFVGWLTGLMSTPSTPRPRRGGRMAVLTTLILEWLRTDEFITNEALGKLAGVSYPTVASVVQELDIKGLLKIRKNRSMRIKYFPDEEMNRLIVEQKRVRKSVYFVDPTKDMIPSRNLLKKVAALGRQDISVSGVVGAQYHFPRLDITAARRIDLVVHEGEPGDIEFVEQLDAGLVQSNNWEKWPDLAVHYLYRSEAFTQKSPAGLLIADPLECLFDLYDGSLGIQADEMWHALKNAVKAREKGADIAYA